MQKFIVPMILAAFVLAGCGAKSGGTPITPSDSDTEATSVPSTSDSSVESFVPEIELDTLHVILYDKQVTDRGAVTTFQGGFSSYLVEKKTAIETVTWDYVGTGKVKTLNDELQAFEASNYPGDIILGAKAIAASADTEWINGVYETYLKEDGEPLEFDFGGNTARRVWLRKTAIHEEETSVLLKYIRTLAGLPEEEETSEDTSSEDTSTDISEDTSADVSEDTSEEISSEGTSEDTSGETSGEISEEVSGETSGEISEEVSGETSGESSEEAQIINLTVAFYERYASTTVQDAWNTAFCTYLYDNGYTLGTVFYTGFASGSKDKGAKFAKEVREYEESSERRFDVLLGGRANLGDETETFINDNFSVYKVDDVEFEYPLGDETNRKLFVRNDTVNTAAVEALVAYFTSIK